ncbi:MAG: AAA family ATPase [Anaerolineaceae bacterium]|nr:AAA family ATPase [Anaerolineaceae bacterium]
MDMDEESSGTRRWFALSFPILNALSEGDVLIVDELDARLHPILGRELIETFHDPQKNPKGAQIIFNTHDTT